MSGPDAPKALLDKLAVTDAKSIVGWVAGFAAVGIGLADIWYFKGALGSVMDGGLIIGGLTGLGVNILAGPKA